MTSKFEFQGKIFIRAEMGVDTGLHIGGTTEGYEIGGIDNPVLKLSTSCETVDLQNCSYQVPARVPYVPGSSLKGKLRSLLEWARLPQSLANPVPCPHCAKIVAIKDQQEKIIGWSGQQCLCGECVVCRLLGAPASKSGPARLTMRDAYPTPGSLEFWRQEMGEEVFTEIKTENVIDRLTSQATPRPMERVPPGSAFCLSFIFDLYAEDGENAEDKYALKQLFHALQLLEDSSLGGSGTRGYGQVHFGHFSLLFRPLKFYQCLQDEKTLCIKGAATARELYARFEEIFGDVQWTPQEEVTPPLKPAEQGPPNG